MSRLPLRSLVALSTTTLAAAELAPSSRPVATSVPSIFVPHAPPASRPEPASPPVSRAMSSEMAAKFAALAQQIAPLPPADGAAAANAQSTLALPPPENGVVRLPSYVVNEEKVPPMSDRQMRTPAARKAIALKRHPGLWLNEGPFFSWAEEMMKEEDAIDRAREMAELSGLYSIGGNKKR